MYVTAAHIGQHILILSVQCDIATCLLLLSAWVRYAGTARSLSKGGAYAFIIIGQVGKIIHETLPPALVLRFRQALSAVSQPVYQILAPKYSERWFDLKGRTTATMIISIGMKSFLVKRNLPQLTRPRSANPIGGALGQLLSPIFSDTRKSVRAPLFTSSR